MILWEVKINLGKKYTVYQVLSAAITGDNYFMYFGPYKNTRNHMFLIFVVGKRRYVQCYVVNTKEHNEMGIRKLEDWLEFGAFIIVHIAQNTKHN